MSAARRSQRNASTEPISYAPARRPASNGSRRGNAPPTPTANAVRVQNVTGQRPIAAKESTSYGAPSSAGPGALELVNTSIGGALVQSSNIQPLASINEIAENTAQSPMQREEESDEEGESEEEEEQEETQSPTLAARSNIRRPLQNLQTQNIASNANRGPAINRTSAPSNEFSPARSYTDESGLARNAGLASTPIPAPIRRTSTSHTTTFRINQRNNASSSLPINNSARNIAPSTSSRPQIPINNAANNIPAFASSRPQIPVNNAVQLPADIRAQLNAAADIAAEQRRLREEAEVNPIRSLGADLRRSGTHLWNQIKSVTDEINIGAFQKALRNRLWPCYFLFALIFGATVLLFAAPAVQKFRDAHPMAEWYQEVRDGAYSIAPSMLRGNSRTNSTRYEPGISDLAHRVTKVEHQLKNLFVNNRKLDQATVQGLHDALPSSMLVAQDREGNLVLSPEFWKAIRSRTEQDMRQKGVTDDTVNIASQGFEDWYNKNEAKVKMWHGQHSQDSWNKHVQDAIKGQQLVSRPEVLSMMQKLLEVHRHEYALEHNILKKTLQDEIQTRMSISGKGGSSTISLTKRQVENIARDTLDQIIPSTQLQALAQVMLRDNTAASLTRYNFFSEGSGAKTDEKHSSPTFDFSADRLPFYLRWGLNALSTPVPTPNPRETALRKWDEAGDCWCAPASPTKPIQLSVILPTPIYLDEIIIEHIPPTSSLSLSTAPKRLEVLVKLEDWNTVIALSDVAAKLFPTRALENALDENWVPIAQFEYDTMRGGAQVFESEVNLKHNKASTKQVIVRVLENEGGDSKTCLYRVRAHGELAPEEEGESVYAKPQ